MTEGAGTLTGTTIGVVGAGMMGGAIAYTCARAGADVVLVARTLGSARRGKAYAERREARGCAAGTTDAARSQALLDRIMPTEYARDRDGARIGLWPGLRSVFGPERLIPFDDVRDRLLFVEVIEALRCVRDGVVASAADADAGSVLGIGFPARTGGVVSFSRSYPGGLEGFTAREHELAARYGDRFLPPEPSPKSPDPSEYS